MKILLIKTSSLGDLIHTFPALTTLLSMFPEAKVDWLVDRSLAHILSLHPQIHQIIPVSLRQIKKNPALLFDRTTWQEIQTIKSQTYDYVIDAQGLLKSAVFMPFIKASHKIGFDAQSARESAAALFYNRKIPVPKQYHAILRTQLLFAKAFGYTLNEADFPLDYGLQPSAPLPEALVNQCFVMLLHGTTWQNKHWPEAYWASLLQRFPAHITPVMTYVSKAEKTRVASLQKQCDKLFILDTLPLTTLSSVIRQARAVVTVDTGLGHLAAALEVPTIALYGPTSAIKTGLLGNHVINLSSELPCAPCLKRQCKHPLPHSIEPPCFESVGVERVWKQLEAHLY